MLQKQRVTDINKVTKTKKKNYEQEFPTSSGKRNI